MIVFASITSDDGIEYEVRGTFRPGSRSTSYHEPDEPCLVEDVEARPEGAARSFPWTDPESLDLDLEACESALYEAGKEPL